MAEIDGLWTAEGRTLAGWPTSGVIMCIHNQVFGGNERYYMVGQYRLQGQSIEIQAHVYHYHGMVHSSLATGIPDFTVRYRGRVLASAGVIEGEVYRTENSHLKLPVRLTRRAMLPA
jgi:hypothetical protein